MQAIEFEAYIKNGIIEIPEQYKDFNDKKIKVIIMTEEINETDNDYIDFLLSNPVKIDNFKPLKRDTIYE